MIDDQEAYFKRREVVQGIEANFAASILKELKLKGLNKCPSQKDTGDYSLSRDNIIKWNTEPFIFLKKNKYTFIKPSTIKEGDPASNSRGNNLIDHFWVSNELLNEYEFSSEIYEGFGEADGNMLFGGVSDHKPVILYIKKKDVGGGRITMSKTKRMLQKKNILGNELCIYKVHGSKKEHVKHKGKLITVADYKKLMKPKK